MTKRKTRILIIETNGRWGGLCHNRDYGEMRKRQSTFPYLYFPFLLEKGEKENIAMKVNVKKKKRPLK